MIWADGDNLIDSTLRSWFVDSLPREAFTEDFEYTEHGPLPTGVTFHRPLDVPDAVADQYLAVLDDFDSARCAMGPEECVVEGGASIGLHLVDAGDDRGSERQTFTPFAIVLLPRVAGSRAIAVCEDCSPDALYDARSRGPS